MYNVNQISNRTLKLVSEPTRYFRQHVALDLSFQSESRWDDKQMSKYMTSLITGKAPSKIIVAHVESCLDACIEGSKDWEYYNKWALKEFQWISIDGNNRTITIDEYLKGNVRLLHGEYCTPQGTVSITSKNDTYDTHPKILREFIEENVSLTVSEYIQASRSDLSEIFCNVNDGVKLNSQELRNARLVPFADWVRDTSKKYYDVFKLCFSTENDRKRRVIDQFVVACAVATTYTAANGVTKKDLDDSYNDDSPVSKATKICNDTFDVLSRIVSKHGGRGLKNDSTLFNLYLLIDQIRRDKKVILDDKAFYDWFIAGENRRLASKDIVFTAKRGEMRTYAGCCGTMSRGELSTRFDIILQDYANIATTIVVELDPQRIFTPSQRYEMWSKQDGRCTVTGREIPESEINNDHLWHADHIMPYSKGGRTTVENGQLICRTENLKKSNKVALGEELV